MVTSPPEERLCVEGNLIYSDCVFTAYSFFFMSCYTMYVCIYLALQAEKTIKLIPEVKRAEHFSKGWNKDCDLADYYNSMEQNFL